MKWIDITDKLPPVGERVLFWHIEYNMVVIDYLEILSASDGRCIQAVHAYIHNYSHWMPLPKSPNIKNMDY